jgi:hypothetical protein
MRVMMVVTAMLDRKAHVYESYRFRPVNVNLWAVSHSRDA